MSAPPQSGGHPQEEIEKAGALPLSQVMAYAEAVHKNTDEYLKTLDDQKLDIVPNPERPNFTIGMMLRNFLIAHGWWHLGEIKYLKGLQGMHSPF
jgi:hypothetical protein